MLHVGQQHCAWHETIKLVKTDKWMSESEPEFEPESESGSAQLVE